MPSQWPLLAAAAVSLFVCTIFSGANLKQGGAGAAQQHPEVAPDLSERLSKFRRVPMPFHSQGLSAREQALVRKLVEASQYLEQIYWRQSDPEGLALLRSLAG